MSNHTNIVGATLLKLFSSMDIFLRIFQEFRNIFPKEYLRKTRLSGFLQMKIKILI